MPLPNYARAWLLVVPLIPSILVTLFDLYHYLRSRALRTALNNHVIILLLLCVLIECLTDIIWSIYFYYNGFALTFSSIFCHVWVLSGSAMYISVFLLMAWASIERHILIFYPVCLSTTTKRLLFHYLPLALCILWPMVFYVVTIFVLPCAYLIRYDRQQCARYNCVVSKPWASLIDSIGNYIAPAFVTVVFSVSLFVRVLYQRYQARGEIQWRNYRKLSLQLLPLSSLCILLQFPPMALYAAYSAGLSRQIAADYYSGSIFFINWLILFVPFACATSLPDLGKKSKDALLFWRRYRVVVPQSLTVSRPKVPRTPTPAPLFQ